MPATTRKPAPKAAETKEAATDVEYGEKEEGSLSGNLTADPELRFTATGRAVTNFSVAVNERIRDDKTGEWADTPAQFFRVTAWGQQAENCAEHLQRGDRIVAVGVFQDRTYTNRDGERVTVTEFTASDIGPSFRFNGAVIKRATRSSK